MIPVIQTKMHDPPRQNGNCFRACIASILEVDIDDLPHFEDMDADTWWPSVEKWCNEHGYKPEVVTFYEQVMDESKPAVKRVVPVRLARKAVIEQAKISDALNGYCLMSGKSPRGDWDHCVVALDGKAVHDPYPGEPEPLKNVVDMIFFRKVA